MRGNFSQVLSILFVFGLLTSCQEFLFDDLSTVTKEVTFDAGFNYVSINDGFRVVLKQDTSNYVIIDAAEETIKDVDCFTSHDTLILNDNNPMKWRTAYPTPTVTIGFNRIKELKIYSPANVSTASTINQDYLKVYTTEHIGEINLDINLQKFVLLAGNTNNMGIYNIAGSADDAYMWIRNACSLNALEFEVKDVRVIQNSKADCYVLATNTIKVTLNSSGDLYYKGPSPEFTLEEQSGSGRIIKIE